MANSADNWPIETREVIRWFLLNHEFLPAESMQEKINYGILLREIQFTRPGPVRAELLQDDLELLRRSPQAFHAELQRRHHESLDEWKGCLRADAQRANRKVQRESSQSKVVVSKPCIRMNTEVPVLLGH